MRRHLLSMLALALLATGVWAQTTVSTIKPDTEDTRYRPAKNRRGAESGYKDTWGNYIVKANGQKLTTVDLPQDALYILRRDNNGSFLYDNAFGGRGADMVEPAWKQDVWTLRTSFRFYSKQFEYEILPANKEGDQFYLRNHHTKLYVGKLPLRSTSVNNNTKLLSERAFGVVNVENAAKFTITALVQENKITKFTFSDVTTGYNFGLKDNDNSAFGSTEKTNDIRMKLSIYKLPNFYEQKEYRVIRQYYYEGTHQRNDTLWVADGGEIAAPVFYGATLSKAQAGGSEVSASHYAVTAPQTISYYYKANAAELASIDITTDRTTPYWNYISAPVNGAVGVKVWFRFLDGSNGTPAFKDNQSRRGVVDGKMIVKRPGMWWAFYGNPVKGFKVYSRANSDKPLKVATRNSFAGRAMRDQLYTLADNFDDGDVFFLEKSLLSTKRNPLFNLRVSDPVADKVKSDVGAYLYNNTTTITYDEKKPATIGYPAVAVNNLGRSWRQDRKASLHIGSLEDLFLSDIVTEEYVGGMTNANYENLKRIVHTLLRSNKELTDDDFKDFDDQLANAMKPENRTQFVDGAYYQIISASYYWNTEQNGSVVKTREAIKDEDGKDVKEYDDNGTQQTLYDYTYYDPIEAGLMLKSQVKTLLEENRTGTGKRGTSNMTGEVASKVDVKRPVLGVIDSFSVDNLWQVNLRASYPATTTGIEEKSGTTLPMLRTPNFDRVYSWKGNTASDATGWKVNTGAEASTDALAQQNTVAGFKYLEMLSDVTVGMAQYRVRMHGMNTTSNYAYRLMVDEMGGNKDTRPGRMNSFITSLTKNEEVDADVIMSRSGVDRSSVKNSEVTDTANTHYSWMFRRIKEFPVKVAAVGFATRYFPFAVKVPAGITVYTPTRDGGTYIEVTQQAEGNVIAAGTPIIIFAEEGTYYLPIMSGKDVDPTEKYTTTHNDEIVMKNNDVLTGNFLSDYRTGFLGHYVLATRGASKQFRKLLANTKIPLMPANRIYLDKNKVNNTANSKAIVFSMGTIDNGGTTTGISTERQAEASEPNDLFYNLDGTVAPKTESGKIYIHNGRKVFIP